MSRESFECFLYDAFANFENQMEDGCPFYIWFASRTHREFENALERVGLLVRQELIWNKNVFTLGRSHYQWKHEPCFYGWKGNSCRYFINARNKATVFDENKPQRSDDHPTMKPVGLFGAQITNSSRDGDIVLDPFGGSGTTIVACEQLGRQARIMELDPRYCDVILARWEKLTGQAATKVEK